LVNQTNKFSQSLVKTDNGKKNIIDEYIIPENGISLEQATKDTLNDYGNYLSHTYKYNLRGLGDRVNIDDASLLGDLWDKHYGNPAFSWDCSAAHADSMVVLSEKLRRLYNIPERFSYGNSGVGVITVGQNDCFFLSLNDAIHKRLNASAKETNTTKDMKNVKNFSVYGVPNEYFLKPLKMKNIHNTRNEMFENSNGSLALDLEKLEGSIKNDSENGLHPLLMIYTIRDLQTSI